MKRSIRRVGAGIVLWIATLAAFARAPVEFDQATWKSLASSPGSAVVVFTSVHCVHCPGLVSDLLRERGSTPERFRVLVVTTDGEPQDLQRKPYVDANDRYYFRGNTQALRHSVSPSWRGVTPYVALLKSGVAPQFHAGRPSADEFLRWSHTSH